MKRLARIVTIPLAFVHIQHQIPLFRKNNLEVTLISSKSSDQKNWEEKLGQSILNIEIPREISIVNDLKSLFNLTKHFIENKFDIVHSSTPKAGLLTAVAGFIARVPVRIHTFTGQRWATMKGPLRYLMIFLDKVIVQLNTQCYADSKSQIEFMRQNGIGIRKKIYCIGHGSYGGVDTQRFKKIETANLPQEFSKYRDDGKFKFIFLGRLQKDKGVEELIHSFYGAFYTSLNVELWLVGPDEGFEDECKEETLQMLKLAKNIKRLGATTSPELFYNVCDVLVLPSYREGFGTVVLEAASVGLPCVGTKISGLVDSVVDGETGILVELKNVSELQKAMIKIYEDHELRNRMSEKSRERASLYFDKNLIAELTLKEYRRLLGE